MIVLLLFKHTLYTLYGHVNEQGQVSCKIEVFHWQRWEDQISRVFPRFKSSEQQKRCWNYNFQYILGRNSITVFTSDFFVTFAKVNSPRVTHTHCYVISANFALCRQTLKLIFTKYFAYLLKSTILSTYFSSDLLFF